MIRQLEPDIQQMITSEKIAEALETSKPTLLRATVDLNFEESTRSRKATGWSDADAVSGILAYQIVQHGLPQEVAADLVNSMQHSFLRVRNGEINNFWFYANGNETLVTTERGEVLNALDGNEFGTIGDAKKLIVDAMKLVKSLQASS